MKSSYITGVPYHLKKSKKKKWIFIIALLCIVVMIPVVLILSGLKFSKGQAIETFNAIQKRNENYSMKYTEKLPEEIAFYQFDDSLYYGVLKLKKVPKLPLWKVSSGDIEKINKSKVFDVKSDFSKIGLRVIPVNDENIEYIAISTEKTKDVIRLDQIATERDKYRYVKVDSNFAVFKEKGEEDFIDSFKNVLAFSKDNTLLYYQNEGEELKNIQVKKEIDEIVVEKEKTFWEKAMENENGFILPYSSEQKYSEIEIRSMYLSKEALNIAQNELYARHGYKFEDEYLNGYFGKKTWYEIDERYRKRLNSVENYNKKTIDKIIGTFFEPQVEEIDLNGDAIKERVSFGGNDICFELKINEAILEVRAMNFDDSFKIIDINKSDDKKEILIKENLIDKTRYYLYRFNGHEIISLGIVDSIKDDLSLIENGEVVVTKMAPWLGGIEYKSNYILNESNIFYEKGNQLYSLNNRYTVLKSFKLFADKNVDSEKELLVNEKERIKFIESDLKNWIKIEKSNGKEGWIYLDNDEYIQGTKLKLWQVFN